MEEGNQGAPSHYLPDSVPLKPRHGPRPWTLLSKNLCLQGRNSRVVSCTGVVDLCIAVNTFMLPV